MNQLEYRPGLNLCRQYAQWFNANANMGYSNNLERAVCDAASAAFHLASGSAKFVLPDGGVLLEDDELRALVDVEVLSLPFDSIALEFSVSESDPTPGHVNCSKRIVFATQYEDMILVLPVSYFDQGKMWLALPEVALPRRDFMVTNYERGVELPVKASTRFEEIPMQDYAVELRALLSTLNALACSNVSTSRFRASKKANAKAALPFDDFHVLTIQPGSHTNSGGGTVSHRSPREHLRRGHIRRLETGRKVWVNAAVVAAGRGAGRVFKDYSLSQRQHRRTAGFADPLVLLAIAVCLVILYLAMKPAPAPEPAPEPTPGASIRYAPFIFLDVVTGCEYLSTHTSTGLVPRIAADGKTHMGCKGGIR